MMTMHANCIKGNTRKVELMKQYGFWLLDDTNDRKKSSHPYSCIPFAHKNHSIA